MDNHVILRFGTKFPVINDFMKPVNYLPTTFFPTRNKAFFSSRYSSATTRDLGIFVYMSTTEIRIRLIESGFVPFVPDTVQNILSLAFYAYIDINNLKNGSFIFRVDRDDAIFNLFQTNYPPDDDQIFFDARSFEVSILWNGTVTHYSYNTSIVEEDYFSKSWLFDGQRKFISVSENWNNLIEIPGFMTVNRNGARATFLHLIESEIDNSDIQYFRVIHREFLNRDMSDWADKGDIIELMYDFVFKSVSESGDPLATTPPPLPAIPPPPPPPDQEI